MAHPHVTHSARFGGGLNLVDAPELLPEGEGRVVTNVEIEGGGRVTTRRAARLMGSATGVVIGGTPFSAQAGVAAVALTYNAGTSTVDLWTISASGAWASVGTVWSGVVSQPKVHLDAIFDTVWMCDEGKDHGLSIYDPGNNLGSGSAIFQPRLDFDQDGTFVAMFPRLLVEHRNHIWIFGYGSDDDPDRPEYGRSTFLGLFDDAHGLGDAGAGSDQPGSDNLFDIEDAFPIAPRGEAIVAASSAPDRLLVLTNRQALVIFGSDFASWQGDKIDSERGAVNGQCLVEAAGVAYWMSPLGPSRYRGGGVVEPLERKVLPVIEEMDFSTLFAVHAVHRHQVRWYYRRKKDSDVAAPNRYLAYDYQAGVWLEGELGAPMRVTTGFHLRPTGLEGPDSAPSGLSHEDVTRTSAVATWTPGDLHPETRTRVYLREGANPFQEVAALESAAARHAHTGLTPSTGYTTRIEQIRNNQLSAAVEASFTTLAGPADPNPETGMVAPTITAENNPVFTEGWRHKSGEWRPHVVLHAETPQEDVRIRYERDEGVAGFVEIHVTEFGWDGYTHLDRDVVLHQSYTYRARAEDRDGNLSPYSQAAAVTVNVTEDRFTPELPPDVDELPAGAGRTM